MDEHINKILNNLVKQVGDRQDVLLELNIYEDHAECYVIPIFAGIDEED